jgi:A/G-specific adenine glycosylase
MLQQTQVATVIPYYRKFLIRFPSLEALAAARIEEVLSAWSGLGYYRRARSLHAAARVVRDRFGGKIPGNVVQLRELPGVGPYTAGALASIAFGLPEPAMDGNALRVLTRLLAQRGDPEAPERRKSLEAAARELLRREGDSGELNQALMELGALICVPASPRCNRCPLRGACRARLSGLERILPESSPGRKAIDLEAAVAVIQRGKSYLMIRRAGEALMRDLWELPGGFLKKGEEPRLGLERICRERLSVTLKSGEKVATLKQTITYRRVRLSVYRAALSEPLPPARDRRRLKWVAPGGLKNLPHGSSTRRVLETIDAVPPRSGILPPAKGRR